MAGRSRTAVQFTAATRRCRRSAGQPRRQLAVELLESRAMLAGDLLSVGPFVGGVTSSSAKVMVRTDAAAAITIEYSTAADFASAAQTPVVQTAAASDFTAIVSIDGLLPESRYYYRVYVNDQLHDVPPSSSFETFAPPGALRDLSFAVMADIADLTRFPTLEAPAYATVAADAPDFLLQIGDFDHRNPVVLTAMRRMHREVLSSATPSGQAFETHIAPAIPLFHVFDDHDFGIDDADKTFVNRASALQAFREYYPTPTLPNPAAGVWHSFNNGQVDVFMLDTRSQRDPNIDPDGPDKSLLDGDTIPDGQKQWLKAGLLNSTATWKFLVSGVPFNPTSKPHDSWGAFATEQGEILDFITTNNITGVVVISADLHSGGAIDDGSNGGGLPELSVPHTNLTLPVDQHVSGTPGTWSEGIISGVDNPGYGFVKVQANPPKVTLEAKGVDGQVRMSFTITLPDTSGPLTSQVVASPSSGTTAPAITARVTDIDRGASNITAAEYFIDVAGAAGSGQPLAAQDGALDEPTEDVSAAIGSAIYAALAPGSHTVFVRGQDAAGNWGSLESTTFTILDTSGPLTSQVVASPASGTTAPAITARVTDIDRGGSNITAAEYFIDVAGAAGSGQPLAAQDGALDEPTEDLTAAIGSAIYAALAPGSHTVFVRGRDAAGNWGSLESTTFTILDTSGPLTSQVVASPASGTTAPAITARVTDIDRGGSNITAAEYFIDVAGAAGSGQPLAAQDGALDEPTEDLTAAIGSAIYAALAPGSHTVFVRGRDAAGNWGSLESTTFTILDTSGPLTSQVVASPASGTTAPAITARVTDIDRGGSNITAAEYFIDVAGAAGSGQPLAAQDGALDEPTEDLTAAIGSAIYAALAPGSHTVFVRGRDAAGNWGSLASTTFTKTVAAPPTRVFYVSTALGGSVTNSDGSTTAFTNADILKLALADTGAFQHTLHFDGSDVGLATASEDIDAFDFLPDGSIVVSTRGNFSVASRYATAGVGSGPQVTGGGQDLLRFAPSTLGTSTTGTWSLYLRGANVGLSGAQENIDAVAVLSDGRLVISTVGSVAVTGVSGADEDLLVRNPLNRAWSMYFDGSDVGAPGVNDDVDGLWVEESTTNGLPTLHLSLRDNGAARNEDIVRFTPTSLGFSTAGSAATQPELDGSAVGLALLGIDGLHIELPAVPTTTLSRMAPLPAAAVAQLGVASTGSMLDDATGPDRAALAIALADSTCESLSQSLTTLSVQPAAGKVAPPSSAPTQGASFDAAEVASCLPRRQRLRGPAVDAWFETVAAWLNDVRAR